MELFDDGWFDDRLPINLQLKSVVHFTPVEVARYAAGLLAPTPGVSVLDVGAGAGKFCIAAALAVPTATFVGVEWRPHLVRVAKQFARECGLANVQFVQGDALELDWSPYDAFYFYNPFAEQHFEKAFILDNTIALDPKSFDRYVDGVVERLAVARTGTRVVTYHGFGAQPPAGYELASNEAIGTDRVELWIKAG